MDWRLADAKNRFSELFTQAISLGPQRVRRFKDAVIVLSEQDYERLTGRQPNFKDFLSEGESFDDLELDQESEFGRESCRMRVLLDTVCSPSCAIHKAMKAVKAAIAPIPDGDLYLSALGVGEIARAVALLPEGRRKRTLNSWLITLKNRFADHVLAVGLGDDAVVGRDYCENSAIRANTSSHSRLACGNGTTTWSSDHDPLSYKVHGDGSLDRESLERARVRE